MELVRKWLPNSKDDFFHFFGQFEGLQQEKQLPCSNIYIKNLFIFKIVFF